MTTNHENARSAFDALDSVINGLSVENMHVAVEAIAVIRTAYESREAVVQAARAIEAEARNEDISPSLGAIERLYDALAALSSQEIARMASLSPSPLQEPNHQ